MKQIIIIAIIVIVFFTIFALGIRRHERVECNQWLKDSEKYENWYPVNWQLEMCREYGIELPIK